MKRLAIAFLIMAAWTGYAVEVVENPAEPENPLGLKLEKTQEFLLEDPEADVFVDQPGPFLVGADGVHYILDVRSFRVYRFGPDGEYLGSFAGKGQGPGQIKMMSTDIFLTHEGQVAIPELVRQVVHFYDPEGRFAGDKKWAVKTGSGVTPLADDGYVCRVSEHTKDRRREWQKIVYLNNRFSDPTTIYEGEKVDSILSMMDPRLVPFCVDGNGNILVVPESGIDYLISRYSREGNLLQEIRRGYKPTERTGEVLEFMKKTGKDMMALFRQGEDGPVPEPGLYEHPIREIGADGHGRIWSMALQGRDSEGELMYAFDVFSPDGKLIDRLERKGIMFRFHKDRLVDLNRNAEGDWVIQHWRIIEPQGGAQ